MKIAQTCQVDTELSMGWVNPRVGLGWVGLGRDFLTFGGLGWVVGPKRQKTKIKKNFICAEFIEATNVVDTDGHGVSRQISQMFPSNCFVNL